MIILWIVCSKIPLPCFRTLAFTHFLMMKLECFSQNYIFYFISRQRLEVGAKPVVLRRKSNWKKNSHKNYTKIGHTWKVVFKHVLFIKNLLFESISLIFNIKTHIFLIRLRWILLFNQPASAAPFEMLFAVVTLRTKVTFFILADMNLQIFYVCSNSFIHIHVR